MLSVLVLVLLIEMTFNTNVFLLNPDNKARVMTEYDFVTQVWAPILKSSLIDIHGVLRMKIGESSPIQGIVGRKRSYSDARVGFKVDLRLLFDYGQNEHDLLALEAVKAGDSSKLLLCDKLGHKTYIAVYLLSEYLPC
ncbi:hypothetical protein PS15m_007371 [Mucor circinelloides]